MSTQKQIVAAILVLGLLLVQTGCGTTHAQKGASSGAAFGALAGGLISGDVGGAVAGAAVGGGLGYVVGNESDKEQARMELEREKVALEKAKISSDPKTAYRPAPNNPLVGSTWRVLSYVGGELEDYASMVVTFQTNSKMTTLVAYKDGKTETFVESYRVVEDVLVITGSDYMLNTKYSIEGKQMIVVAPDRRIVLEEVEEKV